LGYRQRAVLQIKAKYLAHFLIKGVRVIGYKLNHTLKEKATQEKLLLGGFLFWD
jgi:hypothetical protein